MLRLGCGGGFNKGNIERTVNVYKILLGLVEMAHVIREQIDPRYVMAAADPEMDGKVWDAFKKGAADVYHTAKSSIIDNLHNAVSELKRKQDEADKAREESAKAHLAVNAATKEVVRHSNALYKHMQSHMQAQQPAVSMVYQPMQAYPPYFANM